MNVLVNVFMNCYVIDSVTNDLWKAFYLQRAASLLVAMSVS